MSDKPASPARGRKKTAPPAQQPPQEEVVVRLPLTDLHPFPDHPFQVRDDEEMRETIQSVKPEEQQILVTTIDYEQATPSLSQAQRMKKFSQTGKLNEDSMLAIMSEEKKSEKFSLTFDGDRIRKYFPKSYTPLQMENTIIKLLEAWQKKRQRSQER